MEEITIEREFDFMADQPKVEKTRYADFKSSWEAFKAYIEENGMVATTGVAARLADVTEPRIRQLIEEGRFTTIKFAGRVYITEESLGDYMNSERKAGRPSKYVKMAQKWGPGVASGVHVLETVKDMVTGKKR
jgi:hypothetical protein